LIGLLPVCIGQYRPLKSHNNGVRIVLQNNSFKETWHSINVKMFIVTEVRYAFIVRFFSKLINCDFLAIFFFSNNCVIRNILYIKKIFKTGVIISILTV